MRRTVAVLVLLLGVVVLAVLWRPAPEGTTAATPGAAAPDERATTTPSCGGTPTADPPAAMATEARTAIEAGVAPSPAHADTRTPDAVVFGRVVDERRKAVAGAHVELRITREQRLASTTAADGGFEIPVFDLAGASERTPLAIARGPVKGFAARPVWLTRSASKFSFSSEAASEPSRIDAGTFALLPSFPLEVRVTSDGRPANGASVAIEVDPFRAVIAEAGAGADGLATFDSLPGGLVHIRARGTSAEGRARAFLPDERELTVELRADESYVVEVVDATTQAPIAGASIELVESYTMPMRSDPESLLGQESGSSRRVEREPVITGADGRARVDGVAAGTKVELRVSAAGYAPSPNERVGPARSGVRLRDPAIVVRVELEPLMLRTVRWPIVAGEVPPPPDGTSTRLRWAPGSGLDDDSAPAVGPGRMERTTLVVDGIEGRAMWIAEAPDGSLASLYAAKDSNEGKPASFRRPRKIEVTIRDRGGHLVRGAGVIARNQGNNALCDWVATDAEGRATLTSLYGGLADVYVAAPDSRGGATRAGSVDLEQGDARIETVLAGSWTVRLALRIDGVPALPARFRATAQVLEEIPERGELRISLPEPSSDEPVAVGVRALGFLPASAKVAPAADGSEPIVPLDLVRATELLVRLHREPAQGVDLNVERWNEEKQAWESDKSLMLFNGLRWPNGPGDSFVISGLSEGRWRAIDRASGTTSDAVDVARGIVRAIADLYIAAEQWVTGRVTVPAGASLKDVVVLVDGAAAAQDPMRRFPGEGPPTGAHIGEDGSFRARIPGDREVTVRPWHPWLSPASGSLVRTTLGRDGVELALAEGVELRIPMTLLAGAKPITSVRVAPYRGAVSGEPREWMYAPIVDGAARFGGLETGRWTLWIDAGREFAPLTLADLDVHDGVNEIRAPALSRGSSIRVRILVAADQSPPRIYVSARSLDGPSYYRNLNSRGEAEAVLSGLGAGRFALSYASIMDSARRVEREVELDGATELALDLDLR